MQLKFYSSFLEQVFERVVSIVTKSYEAFYFGIHQHPGTEYTGWVRNINRGASEVNAVERCLYNYVLLCVNCTAYFMPGSRFYIHLIPEATKFKAIFKPGGGAIIACG